MAIVDSISIFYDSYCDT